MANLNNPINYIAFLRVSRGLTQQAVADSSGLCRSQVQKIEVGTYNVKNMAAKTVYALAVALGTTVEDILQNS